MFSGPSTPAAYFLLAPFLALAGCSSSSEPPPAEADGGSDGATEPDAPPDAPSPDAPSLEASDPGDAADASEDSALPPPICDPYAPPASFNPSDPTVSFSNDVLPIFTLRCSFPACHGSKTSNQANLFLGLTASDAARVYANLVGAASVDYPPMPRVTAGDPANSYLLHRLDDDACTLPGCTTGDCYSVMPQGGPTIPETERLAIRGWIAQGALSDVPPDGGSLDAALDAASDASQGSPDAGDGGAGDASAADSALGDAAEARDGGVDATGD